MKYLFIALAGYVLISHLDRALFPKPSPNERATADWSSAVKQHLPTASAAVHLPTASAGIRFPTVSAGIHFPFTSAGFEGDANTAAIRQCCEKIIGDYQRIFFLQDRSGKMKLQLRGVYAHGAALFFLLRLNNRSPLDYDVDSIRFFIAGTGKGKIPPPGAKLLTPVYVYDSTVAVPGYTRATSIFVLPRFTLSPGRQLFIDVQEKNGGRHLQVQASNLTLVRARLI
jgi:hypothetical protein